MSQSIELVENAAGRLVPTVVNGQKQTPFQGVGKFQPEGRKAAPPVRSCNDYPRDGNKVVAWMGERDRGIEGSRDQGAEGSRDRGIKGSRAGEAGSECATALEQCGSDVGDGAHGSQSRGTREGASLIPARAKRCDSRVEALKVALQNAGVRDGMRISSHHHFRNGDLVAVPLFQAAAELGVKDLIWFPSRASRATSR